MTFHRTQLLNFFRDELGIDVTSLDNETPLCSSGLIDSFLLVQLIYFVEELWGIEVAPTDINLDNLDTIGRILSFADRTKTKN